MPLYSFRSPVARGVFVTYHASTTSGLSKVPLDVLTSSSFGGSPGGDENTSVGPIGSGDVLPPSQSEPLIRGMTGSVIKSCRAGVVALNTKLPVRRSQFLQSATACLPVQ
uniref:Uncharacterized protein n=1 Tax=Branchiostoma floridae TaxID=7739 RepID=C3YPY9_BRAFL|eukprot:XP_002601615.1 hypothetical protein BRAFLDRAFT_85816 [Branchiostoma floridae]